jgi:hypothetical protein
VSHGEGLTLMGKVFSSLKTNQQSRLPSLWNQILGLPS